MSMSVAEAAKRLGRSPQQVRIMMARRDLQGQRVGRSWVVDERSVAQAASRERFRGRPFSPARAWGALAILSGDHPAWLSSAARYQVREVILSPRMENRSRWASLLAGAWSRQEMSCHPGVLNRLLKDPRVVEVGVAAASRHGLDLLAGAAVPEVVVDGENVSSIVSDYMLEDAESQEDVAVVVHVPRWEGAHLQIQRNHRLQRLLVALSLLRSEDPRARKAGQDAFSRARSKLAKK